MIPTTNSIPAGATVETTTTAPSRSRIGLIAKVSTVSAHHGPMGGSGYRMAHLPGLHKRVAPSDDTRSGASLLPCVRRLICSTCSDIESICIA